MAGGCIPWSTGPPRQYVSEISHMFCVALTCVWLFVTPWTVACQAPLSMELSKQEYLSGLPTVTPLLHSASLVSPF